MKSHRLDVYLYQNRVGQLSIDDYGDMTFTYDFEYQSDKANPVLSNSLPLQEAEFDKRQCRPFFSGLLPEAHLRIAIARQLGLSEKNDFALLRAIGGECAGAVMVVPEATTHPLLSPDYKILKRHELVDILETMHQRPMIAGEDGIRLSLAGAQDKLPVALIDGQIGIPMHGAPSTHILKPINRDFPSLIENECFCLKLAKRVGLNVADADLYYVNNHPYLLVKRYDRVGEAGSGIQRLHQEDFCQAMGIMPEIKYQREGGPALADCFGLVRRLSSRPVVDLKALLHGVIFNLIIGNNDAHGKNFSLLYHNKVQARLAPLYDLISTCYYPNLTSKMAMKIGSKYEFDGLFERHILQMAQEISLSSALVYQEVVNLIGKVEKQIGESPFTPTILMRIATLKKRLGRDS